MIGWILNRWTSPLLSPLVDLTVLFSFDRTGYRIHAAGFHPGDLDVDLTGRVCLVTGANSGLGRETALALAHRRAQVWLLCRDRQRGEVARRTIRSATGNDDVHLALVDLSQVASVRACVDALPVERVDVLVHNAGVLPDERRITDEGNELTWATGVVGPFALTAGLLPRLVAAEEPRVITVSSGGMYTQRLSLRDLEWDEREFDGVAAYAMTKRAQVVLNEQWAERQRGSIDFHAMHPGWADTPGVRTSLPRFHSWLQRLLRTPAEGADTIVWLAVCRRLDRSSGRFWFDRKARRTHYLPGTRESDAARRRLWQDCLRRCDLEQADLGPATTES